ncbi:hypothetical protein KIN20_006005 [Parelaphostrongylus tenuis]|uniref:Uncharacterized protein n=1 Tax=Parelaphostrongylus tenuis TaxID=148309 RepID=A0AAD5QKM8_PARTN|nr:hypothetical protein KIN20_006005 [Parelaphostrongylus tenuis]
MVRNRVSSMVNWTLFLNDWDTAGGTVSGQLILIGDRVDEMSTSTLAALLPNELNTFDKLRQTTALAL